MVVPQLTHVASRWVWGNVGRRGVLAGTSVCLCRPRSRHSSPDSRPRSSSAATSSTYHDSRGGSLRVSADPSAQPSFKVDPSSLVPPGGEASAPYAVAGVPLSRNRHARPHSTSAASLLGLPQQPPPLPRAVDLRASSDAAPAAGDHDTLRRYGEDAPASVGGGGRSGAPTPPSTAAGPALSVSRHRESSRDRGVRPGDRSSSARRVANGHRVSVETPGRTRPSSRSQSQPQSRPHSQPISRRESPSGSRRDSLPDSRMLSRTSSRGSQKEMDAPSSPRPASRTRRHVFRSNSRSVVPPTPGRGKPPAAPVAGSRRALHSTGSSAITPRQRVPADPQPSLWWNRQLHTIGSTSIRRTPPPVAPSHVHRGSGGSVPGGVWYPPASGMPSPPRRRTRPPPLSWSGVDVQHDSPERQRWAAPRTSHPPPPAAPKSARRSRSSRDSDQSVDGAIGVGSIGIASLPVARSADPPQLHVSGGIGRHRLNSGGVRVRSPSPAAMNAADLASYPLNIDAARSVSSSGSRRGSAGGSLNSGRVYPQGSYRSGWIPPGNK